jgi:hypothetical protein
MKTDSSASHSEIEDCIQKYLKDSRKRTSSSNDKTKIIQKKVIIAEDSDWYSILILINSILYELELQKAWYFQRNMTNNRWITENFTVDSSSKKGRIS